MKTYLRRISSFAFVVFLLNLVWLPYLVGKKAAAQSEPAAAQLGVNPEAANKAPCPNPGEKALTQNDVRLIIQQAVTRATNLGVKATIAVTDREANVLAVYRMKGASRFTQINDGPLAGTPIKSEFAAISKAGTCAYFSTSGNAFTPRSAGFIVQEHSPPGVNFTPGGPLFGVQFSSLVFITDVNGNLPLGLAADPGGVPLYIKNPSGVVGLDFAVGGIGVEIDGVYGVDKNPDDNDQSIEEIVAVAGSRGFESPSLIRADNILVDGVRIPFVNAPTPTPETLVRLDDRRFLNTAFQTSADPVAAGTPYLGTGSHFRCDTLRGLPVRVLIGNNLVGPNRDPQERFPLHGNRDITATEVENILYQGISQAYKTRGAIRQPLGSFAELSVCVVGVDGEVLGFRGTPDAALFGVDVSVQKARTAAFFSRSDCGDQLRKAGLGKYVDAAAKDGIRLDGSIAFSDRAVGFLHRPFLPDGINDAPAGPFSTSIGSFSIFNVGLEEDLLVPAILDILNDRVPPPSLKNIPKGVRNGFQIFAGSVPLYRNGRLIGAVGISGDGIDQDDLVGTNASAGFEAPVGMRADQVLVRGIRLPWVKFPRHPEL
ncbi:MAG: heme-binding protein [Blastocatellia bacterium]|nr:heme-binding protein [Blastocatellia bacterium]